MEIKIYENNFKMNQKTNHTDVLADTLPLINSTIFDEIVEGVLLLSIQSNVSDGKLLSAEISKISDRFISR